MRLLGFYQYGTHSSVRAVIDSSALCYIVILFTASACMGCDHRRHSDNFTVMSTSTDCAIIIVGVALQ